MSYNSNSTRASGGRGSARYGPQVQRKPVPDTPELVISVTPDRDTKNFRVFTSADDAFMIATVYVPLSHPCGQQDEVEVVIRPKAKPARRSRTARSKAA